MVRAEGLEPHDSRHWYLKPTRLPIPPRPHFIICAFNVVPTHYQFWQHPMHTIPPEIREGMGRVTGFETGDLQCHKLAL